MFGPNLDCSKYSKADYTANPELKCCLTQPSPIVMPFSWLLNPPTMVLPYQEGYAFNTSSSAPSEFCVFSPPNSGAVSPLPRKYTTSTYAGAHDYVPYARNSTGGYADQHGFTPALHTNPATVAAMQCGPLGFAVNQPRISYPLSPDEPPSPTLRERCSAFMGGAGGTVFPVAPGSYVCTDGEVQLWAQAQGVRSPWPYDFEDPAPFTMQEVRKTGRGQMGGWYALNATWLNLYDHQLSRLDGGALGWATKEFYGFLKGGDEPWYKDEDVRASPNDAREDLTGVCMHEQDYEPDPASMHPSVWERRYDLFYSVIQPEAMPLWETFCGFEPPDRPGCPTTVSPGFSPARSR